ncbi:DNA polymerase beta domain-containing protein region [Thermincola ferriacetica]|uniref:DNA polymerase beta domain protein region n=2 Tax=Thermincola TaxID=278993 RepID=D5XF67_THEPJ|nr:MULTISPECIES: nucleotidyltransferase domain-containing protein [Thermincola]ADG82288.1 DNA polymerase beta domain protein region [Thermincola potens JR]KNZ69361.1 DNA polymerase beta domain-containing protein region [Thermincola ferriacetica]
MLLTPEERKKYVTGWRRREEARREALEKRKLDALDKTKKAAGFLKEKYGVKVFLFGSLAWGGFWERSDIDLAVEGFSDTKNYFKVLGEVWDIVSPFNVDLVLLQDIDESFRKKIQADGIIL